MNFVLAGKAGSVLPKLKEIEKLCDAGGGILYEGNRSGEPKVKKVIIRTGKDRKLETISEEELNIQPSRELYDHSSGFEWGYGGSGPAQLALALLLDATGNRETALKHYQEFKVEFVSRWGAQWSIHSVHILRFIALKQNLNNYNEVMGNV